MWLLGSIFDFAFIGTIVALVLIFKLRSRVKKLEQAIKDGVPSAATSAPAAPEALQESPQAQNIVITKQEPIKPADSTPGAFDRLGAWLKEDWLLKLGAFLLIIGFGWLTTYAFLNNWIGPMGRITLGIVAGALFIVLGWWRIRKYIHQGGVFLVLGSTVILLTVFAAREIYGFFTPLSALVIMFMSAAFVALASVKYNNRLLALASLVLASLAPLLTNSPMPNYVSLFSYLLIVVLGTTWVVVLTGRRELTAASLIIVAFYSLPHILHSVPSDKGALLLFAYAFAAVFFLTNTAGILKLKGKDIVPDLVSAAGNGLLLLAWIMAAAPDEWKSLIIVAWMIVFVVGAFLTFRITMRHESFYTYAGIAIAMLGAATAAELDGAALTIAYTIECVVTSFVAYAILKDIKIAQKLGLLLIGPATLSVQSILSSAWRTSVVNDDFFVLLILATAFLSLGAFSLYRLRGVEEEEPHKLGAALLVIGSIYAYALIWLSLHAGLRNDSTAVMISLIIYTVIGLICYFYGLFKQHRGLRLYGGIIVGLVVGRLLLVEVWRMELTGRITTFFIIGTLLISTAFLRKRKQANVLVDKTE